MPRRCAVDCDAVCQVGTSFAFAKESGLVPEVKQFVLRKVRP